jgi:subfamily B ATP-binding cassette protein MsbA
MAREMSSSGTTRRLVQYFKPHRYKLCLAVVLMGFQALIPGTLVLLIEQVLDEVLIAKDSDALLLMPFALILLYLVGGVLKVTRGMLTRTIAWDVITQLRSQLFWHLLKLDARWHQKHPTGSTIARVSNDVTTIQYGVSGIVTAIQQPLTLIVLLCAAAWMNPWLTLLAISVLPLIIWPISRFGDKLRQSSRASLNNMATLSSTVGETFAGIRVVTTFGGEATRGEAFELANQEQRRLQMRAHLSRLFPGPIIELIASIGVGAVLWIGGHQVFAGQLQAGELVAFMVALGLLNEPLKGISKIHNLTQQARAGAENVFAILDTHPVIADDGIVDAPDQPTKLIFKDVSFDYGDEPVLRNVDFHIDAGEVVAVVGPSGSGKSTLANMIPRLMDPNRGSIMLGDRDIKDYRLRSLRQGIAIVSQDTFLFDDTILANISFGSNATQNEIEDAARAANAHDFIVSLPHGYHTRVDERGIRLSGGQRQRICIARAILRNPSFLILDEATSALDAESEALVQEAIERLMKGRSVLAIAHRLSTVRQADRILVLDQGAIVEHGNHDALIAAQGSYARLVQRQTVGHC